MPGIGTVNLKVLLLDSDFYALQAVNSYLAWDRRTRVTYMAEDANAMWAYLSTTPDAEKPDVVVLDADHMGGPSGLSRMIDGVREQVPAAAIVCLAQFVDAALVSAALAARVNGYFLKQEARLQIAWAIVFAVERPTPRPLVVTPGVRDACADVLELAQIPVLVLPGRRQYPELTDRIRQAIKLCVIEGMPAHLAADEMGISLHTIRGYVKEGYRILESYDDTEYPVDMTPQERAFMRFTALEIDDGTAESPDL